MAGIQESRRTEEEVHVTAQAAGLSRSHGPVQLLRFSPHLNAQELKLMELPSDVLEALKKGDRVVVRGDPSDEAVLCTGNRTYELKIAETSNALLLSPDLFVPSNAQFQRFGDGSLVSSQVVACLGDYFELRCCQPKTQKLRELLSECPYKGPEYEGGLVDLGASESMDTFPEGVQKKRKGPHKYTVEELKERVQASDAELLASLEQQQACPVDGFWRVFDPDYRDRVVLSILTLLEEEDGNYFEVPLEGCMGKLLQLEPRFAIEHCLKWYGTAFTSDMGGKVSSRLDGMCPFNLAIQIRGLLQAVRRKGLSVLRRADFAARSEVQLSRVHEVLAGFRP